MKHLKQKFRCACCGTVHTIIPVDARPWIEEDIIIGWFWECACHSTVFEDVEDKALAMDQAMSICEKSGEGEEMKHSITGTEIK